MPGRIRALEANSPLIADSIVNRGYKYRVQSHALIQEFCLGGGGGGGVQARLSENSFFFLVLNIVIFQEVRTPYYPLDPLMNVQGPRL